jgi:hypothetical protein
MKKSIRDMVTAKLNAGAYTFHKDGTITAKWGYFYVMGRSPEGYMNIIKNRFPGVEIVDRGDHYHDFVGGAKVGSAKSSYMWVRFKLP